MSVREVMREQGVTLEDLARVASVSEWSARKYLYGERALVDKVQYALVREFGQAGKIVAGAIERAREEYLEEHPFDPTSGQRLSRRSKPSAKVVEQPIVEERDVHAELVEEDTGERYSIEEWKRLFGEPGGGVTHDRHGRVFGIGGAYFATEPCFCEE